MRAYPLGYLKTRRGQVILACFVLSSVLFTTLPGIDLFVSGLFYNGGFRLRDHWWPRLMHNALTYFLCLSLSAVVVVYLCNKVFRQNLFNVDGKKVAYLFLVLILGAGLIVNVGLKDSFGRARPRDIVEFGGTKQFTPPFVISHECNTNCSFSSGDGAGGFFALALALALSRRRSIYLAGIATGVMVSLARIASGAHFFSDTVVSFFVMLIAADALYYYMLLPAAAREQALLLEPVLPELGAAVPIADTAAQRTRI